MKKSLKIIGEFLGFFIVFEFTDWFSYRVLGVDKWYVHLVVYVVIFLLLKALWSFVKKKFENRKKSKNK